MVRTGLLDVTFLEDEEILQAYYDKVPDFRKEKADKIKSMRGKALSLGVWTLFQRMKEEYGIEGEVPHNFSHSGRYSLCSIEDKQTLETKVGCDVESVGKVRLEIAERFFCESENAYVRMTKTSEQQIEAFYRMWVLKESFIKATGYGMKMDLKSFEIGFRETDLPYLKNKPSNVEGHYWYKEYNVAAGDAKIAVCASNQEFDETLHVYRR